MGCLSWAICVLNGTLVGQVHEKTEDWRAYPTRSFSIRRTRRLVRAVLISLRISWTAGATRPPPAARPVTRYAHLLAPVRWFNIAISTLPRAHSHDAWRVEGRVTTHRDVLGACDVDRNVEPIAKRQVHARRMGPGTRCSAAGLNPPHRHNEGAQSKAISLDEACEHPSLSAEARGNAALFFSSRQLIVASSGQILRDC